MRKTKEKITKNNINDKEKVKKGKKIRLKREKIKERNELPVEKKNNPAVNLLHNIKNNVVRSELIKTFDYYMGKN